MYNLTILPGFWWGAVNTTWANTQFHKDKVRLSAEQVLHGGKSFGTDIAQPMLLPL